MYTMKDRSWWLSSMNMMWSFESSIRFEESLYNFFGFCHSRINQIYYIPTNYIVTCPKHFHFLTFSFALLHATLNFVSTLETHFQNRVPRQFSNFTYKIKLQWICHAPSAQALNTNLSRTVSLCKLNFHDHDLIKIHKSLKLTLKDNLCAIQRRNCRLCNRSSDGSSAQGADHFFEFFPYVYVLVWRVINVPFMTPQIPLTVCYLTMLFNVSVKNRLFILHFNHLIL